MSLPQDAWKQLLKQGFSEPKALLAFLGLDQSVLPDAEVASKSFAFKVPLGFAKRMRPGDIHDPLLLQVLPVGAELLMTPGFSQDPLQEAAANKLPGLLHKYKNRVLFIVSQACAVNCRYCFRRHFPYADNNPGTQGWDKAIGYIAEDTSIEEVIFSGGDPLVINDKQLAYLVQKIADIPHVKNLRIHTRLPIVLPERVSDGLIDALTHTRLPVVMVVHSNHANEIDETVRIALAKLKASGMILLNQAVLLRGINDSVSAQVALHKTMFAAGVLPYYLHLLDPVQGTAHFDVPEAKAKDLMRAMQSHLPGYLLPKLAREVPECDSKTLVHF